LTTELRRPDRDYPIVVITCCEGNADEGFWASAVRALDPSVPVYLVGSRLCRRLAEMLGPQFAVEAGDARIFWSGVGEARDGTDHPLVPARSASDGRDPAERLVSALELSRPLVRRSFASVEGRVATLEAQAIRSLTELRESQRELEQQFQAPNTAGLYLAEPVRASSKVIRVVLGQFGALVGRGLIEILREDESFNLIGRDLDCSAIECTLVEQKPEIVILDEGSIPEPSLLSKLLVARPEIGLVVVVHLPTRAYAARLLAAGATCLSKDASPEEIRATVHLAAGGHHMPTFDVDHRSGPIKWGEVACLTPRQTEVLRYMRLGQTYPTIACTLGIDVETVRTHAEQVRRKLGVARKSELVGLHVPGVPAEDG
jgi:two-component system, NarL family, response regulator YdfI